MIGIWIHKWYGCWRSVSSEVAESREGIVSKMEAMSRSRLGRVSGDGDLRHLAPVDRAIIERSLCFQ